MSNVMLRVLLFSCSLTFSACSFESNEPAAGDHIWKSQTDALQKARDIEQQLANDVNEKRRKIEQQSQ